MPNGRKPALGLEATRSVVIHRRLAKTAEDPRVAQ